MDAKKDETEEEDDNDTDADTYLYRLEQILKRVHTSYFDQYDKIRLVIFFEFW